MPVQPIRNAEQLNAQALADLTSSRKLPSIFQELTQALPARALGVARLCRLVPIRLQSLPLSCILDLTSDRRHSSVSVFSRGCGTGRPCL
jgi:hypothetical protein